MQVTALRAHSLRADLAAPMRSRGDVGYREYFHTGSEVQRLTAVEVLTETEHTGVTLLGGDAREWLETVAAPRLVGKDPRAVRHRHRELSTDERPAAHRHHANRLEFALWDLAAKAAGLPLWRFLGGEDPHVDVYAGGGSLCWNPLPLLIEETKALLARGFRALKIKIGHGPEEDAALVRALRRLCGPQVRIMVDANRAYDLPGALRLRAVLEEEGVYWFEEPFVYDDAEPWRKLQEGSPVLVTGGEGFSRVSQAADSLRDGLVEVLQCDAGGFCLTDLLAIGALARDHGASLTPHSCNTAIGFVIACHLQTALPNGELQEFETFDNPFIHSLLRPQFPLVEGRVVLPETPGLGVTLDLEALERYAYH